ncbi:hypothetical protein CSV63_07275 [Sporosarcina sp. P34]|uniref:helix-turn-helix domain-containing protein n=1 Tax=Sporosarcina sp. P34 TaxID=2048247 RepID=UPI000C16FDC5|nr:helix-turn-helix transcriptional regulator [Sporosarcina sp. P34]PID15574.1 hypothetical protein CSV63_07275 [Sporosarcina sp. P34]
MGKECENFSDIEYFTNRLGKRIKVIREIHGMSKVEFSKKTGISGPYLSQIENENRNIGLKFILLISRAFDLPIELFIYGDDDSLLDHFGVLEQFSAEAEIKELEERIMELKNARLQSDA